MTIHLGSRYENSTVDFVAYSTPDSAAPVVFYSFTDIGRITYNEYVWKEGDRLDQIAVAFYKYPEAWWIITEHNPQIIDPTNIPAGTVLRIPNV